MSVIERIPWLDQQEVAQLIGAHFDCQHRPKKDPGRLDVVGVSFADVELPTLWLHKAHFRDCDFSRVNATAASFNGSTFKGCREWNGSSAARRHRVRRELRLKSERSPATSTTRSWATRGTAASRHDPATGRYFKPDPIALNGGLNTYSG